MASRTKPDAYVKKHTDTVNSTGYGFSGGVLGQEFSVAIQKNNPELKAALDTALVSMIKDGTLKQLSEMVRRERRACG
ncbi:transporter substrate-binding domain-containing protein (plasmid) [Pseudomonas silvicola]|nr:transporter substrate-binding domain-containing protein [Pseudomonas silvicola]